VSRVLVVAEHDGARLDTATAKCVRCALDLKPEALVVAVLAHSGDEIAAQAAQLSGVTQVLLVDAPHNAAPLAAILAPQLESLARSFTHLLGPSSTFGKDLLPRTAALLGVGQISDVLAVLGPHRCRRNRAARVLHGCQQRAAGARREDDSRRHSARSHALR
jgi:electron transfer flavoprotein alpha subunit